MGGFPNIVTLKYRVERDENMLVSFSVLRTGITLLLAHIVLCIGVVPTFAIQDCDFTESIPRSRPNPEAGPTQVEIALFVFDLISIDSVKQEFRLDFYVEAQWTDERLGTAVRNAGVPKCTIPLEDVWRPHMFLVNARSFSTHLPKVLTVSANGTVEGDQRIIGTFSAPLDLTDFPMDRQTLNVTFISTQHSPEELTVVATEAGAAQDFTEPGWSASLGRAYPGSYEMELILGAGEEAESLSRFDFEISVKRDVRYYFWKAFLPLCLIVMISWTVFWIDPVNFNIQTGIGTAAMLTVIAFLFSLGHILPKVPYLTRLDLFVYSSLLFIFFAFVESVVSCTMVTHNKEVLARRMDRWCRPIFPLTFAAVVAWFWWV
jgi:hypothetical protein